MSERTAKNHILELFQKAVSTTILGSEGDNDDEEESSEDCFSFLGPEDRTDLIATFLGLLTLSSKLKVIFKEKIKEWLLKHQEQLNLDLVDKIRELLEDEAMTSHYYNPPSSSGKIEHCNLMLKYLIKNLSNFYELFHIKPIGVVVCLIETNQNYATSGDFIQIKLQM